MKKIVLALLLLASPAYAGNSSTNFGGGGGTPGGNDTEVQVNEGGVFQGYSGLTYDTTPGLVVNEAGTSTVDVRMESDNEANMFFLDASADVIQFGNATSQITRSGTVSATSFTATFPVTTNYGGTGTGTLGGLSKQMAVVPLSTFQVVGSNQAYYPVPKELNKFTVSSIVARSNTVSPTTGSSCYSVARRDLNGSEFSITTNLCIDAGETISTQSGTTATYANNVVAFGDMVTTSITSTGTDRGGLWMDFTFTKTDIQG